MSMGKIKGSGLIHKTWVRCRSFGSGGVGGGGGGGRGQNIDNITSKPRSWPCSPESPAEDKGKMRRRVVPEGCFSVYVGPERQRFVIKTACINHPLFKMLLEEAELEYGYNIDGPLMLPCDVEIFYNILSQMDGDDDKIRRGCTFPRRYGSYHQLVRPSLS